MEIVMANKKLLCHNMNFDFRLGFESPAGHQ